MKKYLAATLLSLFVFSVFSQDNLKNRDYYLQKSKKQKTAAWILAGTGATLAVSGVAIGLRDDIDNAFSGEQQSSFSTGAVLAYTGIAAMVGSIVLISASSRNRKKAAASVSFKMEKTTIIKSSIAYSCRYPTVALQIRL